MLCMLFFGGMQPSYAQSDFSVSNNTVIPIPDNTGEWAFTYLNVTGIPEDYHIFHMELETHINHTWVGDLTMVLADPSNNYLLGIVDRPGSFLSTQVGYSSNLAEPILFTDYASTSSEYMGQGVLSDETITGSFYPSWFPGPFNINYESFSALAKYYEGDKNGNWIFWAKDNNDLDSGEIQSLTLNVGYDRYCVPFMGNDFEYITNVSFGSLNYTSNGFDKFYPDYQTVDLGHAPTPVIIGETYPLSVSIMADELESIFLFVDWNQDGDFSDSGETYTVVTNTSEMDPHTLNVTVPTTAALGETRMRVQLTYSNSTPNSCFSGDGETEDFTLLVQSSMGVDDIHLANEITLYPNPVIDVLTIETKHSIQNIAVYNLGGQEVASFKPIVQLSNQISLGDLPSGVYMLKLTTNKGTITKKIIKK